MDTYTKNTLDSRIKKEKEKRRPYHFIVVTF